jgi:hydroxyacylglutathione hydrolase
MKLPATKPSLALLLLTPILAWSGDLGSGSMDVQWDPGAETCPAAQTNPIQVHRFNAQTIVLREKLCSTWEAPFMYLLIGNKRALLIDTGDIADAKLMPLQTLVMSLLPGEPAANCRCWCCTVTGIWIIAPAIRNSRV